ncbi:ATP-binding protein [Haploplasma axanthum]|uniref:Sensory histidine kinase DcuS n=1 Tax=Haploplasma axanthum TaxID=29552 RepID=A0A449BCQ7_HAPAX|nr:ATP-binding protein [Haploplasma axanthum]VEU80229.1 sensory histidine kinase DcuS [Haploplasma axanthum]
MMTLFATEEIVLNIPRIYTVLAEWLACLSYIYFSPKRFSRAKTIIFSIIGLLVMTMFHLWSDTWNINFWILGMIVAVLIMYGFVMLISKSNPFTAGYITVIAFIMSEFAASLEWQIEHFIITNSSRDNIFIKILIYSPIKIYHLRISFTLIITYALIFIAIFYLEKRYWKRKQMFNAKKNDLLAVAVVGILVFSISNISFLNINTPITSNNPTEMFYIRTLVDLAGIVILYSQREHKYATQKSMEVYTMNNLLDKQYEQYRVSMVSTDIINQKYHDLKHHISVIRAETDYDKKMGYIDDLENSIKQYESNYQTGNKVLDIILGSKHDIFVENKINFTCVADGTLLDFIEVMDLVSIFGNALDNAIENLKEINDPEKRLMKLAIFSQANLLMIRIENYYQNKLKYEYGNLVTTKGDNSYHGYGIKSIRSAVDKYGGSLTINTESNWFTIMILIPITQN